MIDLLDVDIFVNFELQDELDMLAFLFGGETDFNQYIDDSTWETIILKFSLYVYNLKHHLLQCYNE